MEHFSQSPTDPAFVQNPYPFYDRARAAGDFFWWDDYAMACAVSHKAVHAVLRERRMGRECPPELAPRVPDHLAPFFAVEAHSMLELEPPRHTRLRSLVLRAFTSRTIAALEPDIRALCHDLIDQFPSEPFDLLTAYAQPVPVIIISRLLGVPTDRADDLLRWSNAMVAMYQARLTPAIMATAATATADFSLFLRDQLAVKRRHPGHDLMSTLIGGDMSEPELISTCILLLNAGHEATVHTLGNGVAAMLAAGQRRSDPAAVEEVMRLDPPLHMFTRWVLEDCDVAGQPFRRGDRIACLLGAANRDPQVWDDPADFRPERAGPAHVAFGGGAHFCVGAPLARMELQIALEVLWQRCPDLGLVARPVYGDVYHFHGLDQLRVRLSAQS